MTGERLMIAIINMFVTMTALGLGLMQDTATSCRPAADLSPRASMSDADRFTTSLIPSGEALRWTTSEGSTLRMKLRVEKRGTYAIMLSVVHGPGVPSISAQIWDDLLTRDGDTTFNLDRLDASLSMIRFDAVPLGPGHHILELTSHAMQGEILLDCVELRRTGRWTHRQAERAWASGPAFLGIELGTMVADGLTIRRVITGTGAEAAGLEDGDVILTIDGARFDSSSRLGDAIRRHRPGDRLELKIRRGDQRLDMSALLGRRAETRQGGTQAADVIKVLDVRPGQVIADLGCGSGWLAEAIAAALGDEGLVYAVEIQEDHIRNLQRSASPNVLPVLSLPDDISLPAGILDTAMLHDVASHVNRSARPAFYRSVARTLKPSGRLVIFGPHGSARSMLDELREYGFIPIDDDELAALSEDALDRRLDAGIVFRYRNGD